MIELPDVNVLIALFDSKHVHHVPAQDWFGVACDAGWATCPLTENGFVRITSNPGYANLNLSINQLTVALQQVVDSFSKGHQFWPDVVSLRDQSLFDLTFVQGYRQLTDLYLLGLCHTNRGTLVTFDGGAEQTLKAIVRPWAGLIRLLS